MRIAALIAVFFFVGTGIGFYAGNQFPRGGVVRQDTGSAEGGLPADRVKENDAGHERVDLESVSDRKQTATASPATDDAPATSNEIEPRPVRGNGAISGRVRFASGEPVAGVTVEAKRRQVRRNRSRRYGPPPTPKTLAERLQEATDEYRWEVSHRVTAVTGPDGSFRLGGLVDGRYDVGAYKQGIEIHTASGSDRTDIEPGVEVSFDAWRVSDVPVRVVLPDGTEPDRASVHWKQVGTDHRNRYRWSPDDRNPQVRWGKHTVYAESGEQQELRSEDQELEVGPGATPSVTLKLKGRPGIAGRVIFPKGWSLESGQVRALRFVGDAPSDEELIEEGKSDWIRDGDNFRFSFTDVEPGQYRLGTGLTRYAIDVTVDITVTDALVEQDIEVPAPDADRYLKVIGYSPDGGVLSDLSFTLAAQSGRGSSSTSAHGAQQDDGSYWLSRKKWPDLAQQKDVALTVTVQSESYGSIELPYAAGDPLLEARFEEPAYVNVIVSGYDPSQKIRVRVRQKAQNRGGASVSSDVGGDGRARAGPLPPGEYQVELSSRRGGSVLGETDVVLQSGENQAEIAVPELYDLTISFPESSRGRQVQLQSSMHRVGGSETIGEDGEVRYSELRAGTYRVMVYGVGGGPELMSVEVRRDTKVEFQAQSINALEVRISDRNGHLATAGLQDGDLIIGIEGQEFENMQQMQIAFVSVMAKESVKLSVERAGRTFQASIDPRKFQDNTAGGNVEPASR